MEFKTVSIIGLGAEGCVAYHAIRQRLRKEQIRVLAEGKRARRLKEEGVVINGTKHELNVVAPGESGMVPDLLIIAVKSYQLDDALEDIRREIGPDTVLMSLMNGLTSEEILAEHFGKEKVIYSLSRINANKTGNHVDFKPVGQVLIGEKDGQPTERILKIHDLFSKSLPCEISPDIQLDIWRKYMLNAACNTVEAIFRGQHLWFQRVPEACDAMECIMQEIVSLANTMGIKLSQQDIRNLDNFFDAYAPTGKCSMVQDVLNKKQTEIDMFMGEALRLGKLHHVDLPVCRFVYDILKTVDKVNAGILEGNDT
ncbi:MAG: ketopantoate reductase family protein [Spirochaetia bacterium]|jgi:2-dehydropantoate 2-reductase|nr:ketopantoate reductase family protein [Spirochaetia bacterium]